VCVLFSDEDRHEEHTFGHNVTCNDACFSQLFDKLTNDKLSSHERKEQCGSLHSIGGSLMYSILCRNILSDIKEHRAVADKDGVKYRELLCRCVYTCYHPQMCHGNMFCRVCLCVCRCVYPVCAVTLECLELEKINFGVLVHLHNI